MRVSNELGAGNPKSAAFSVVVVTSVSFIISVIIAVIILALRHVISYAFTEGEVVANAVSELCPLLGITLVLNGVQPVLSGTHLPSLFSKFSFTLKYLNLLATFDKKEKSILYPSPRNCAIFSKDL